MTVIYSGLSLNNNKKLQNVLDIKPGFEEGQGLQSTAFSMDSVYEKRTEALLPCWTQKLEQFGVYQEVLLSVYYKEKQTDTSISIKCISEKKNLYVLLLR